MQSVQTSSVLKCLLFLSEVPVVFWAAVVVQAVFATTELRDSLFQTQLTWSTAISCAKRGLTASPQECLPKLQAQRLPPHSRTEDRITETG